MTRAEAVQAVIDAARWDRRHQGVSDRLFAALAALDEVEAGEFRPGDAVMDGCSIGTVTEVTRALVWVRWHGWTKDEPNYPQSLTRITTPATDGTTPMEGP